jgi:hypothetical protein
LTSTRRPVRRSRTITAPLLTRVRVPPQRSSVSQRVPRTVATLFWPCVRHRPPLSLPHSRRRRRPAASGEATAQDDVGQAPSTPALAYLEHAAAEGRGLGLPPAVQRRGEAGDAPPRVDARSDRQLPRRGQIDPSAGARQLGEGGPPCRGGHDLLAEHRLGTLRRAEVEHVLGARRGALVACRVDRLDNEVVVPGTLRRELVRGGARARLRLEDGHGIPFELTLERRTVLALEGEARREIGARFRPLDDRRGGRGPVELVAVGGARPGVAGRIGGADVERVHTVRLRAEVVLPGARAGLPSEDDGGFALQLALGRGVVLGREPPDRIRAVAELPGTGLDRRRIGRFDVGARRQVIGRDEADLVVAGVGDVVAGFGGHGDIRGTGELRAARHPAVAAAASGAGARIGRDRAIRRHPADPVLALVGDQEAAVGERRDSHGCVQVRGGGRSAIAERAADVRAGNGRDGPVRGHAADAPVARVHEQEAAVGER